jgi:cytochrome c-type biogenesis protein
MESWLQETLAAGRFGPAVLPAAFLLGMLGAVSSCCTLPTIGAVAGYAGSLGERRGLRDLLLTGLFFLLGTLLSLATIGAVASHVGRLAAASLGRYGRVFGGLVMVLFGLAGLRLLHIRIPTLDLRIGAPGRGAGGAMLYGLAVGGATTACSVGCNPLLLLAVGATALQGTPLLGAAILAAFALGYSLPLTAVLLGIGFGLSRLGGAARRLVPALRGCVGLLLIVLGFYLLATA